MGASPGALEVQLLQGIHRPDLLEVVSTWESQDAYERARGGSALAATLREVDDLLASPVDERLHHAI
jgi:quinol monooxygenase YgiN